MGLPQGQTLCPSGVHGKGWAVNGNLPLETGSQQRKALWVTDESHTNGVNILLRKSLHRRTWPGRKEGVVRKETGWHAL